MEKFLLSLPDSLPPVDTVFVSFPFVFSSVTHIAWILDFLHQHSVFPFFHLKVSLFLPFYFYSGNFPLLCHSAILCILNFHILFLRLWVFKIIIFKHVFYSSLRILIRLNSAFLKLSSLLWLISAVFQGQAFCLFVYLVLFVIWFLLFPALVLFICPFILLCLSMRIYVGFSGFPLSLCMLH